MFAHENVVNHSASLTIHWLTMLRARNLFNIYIYKSQRYHTHGMLLLTIIPGISSAKSQDVRWCRSTATGLYGMMNIKRVFCGGTSAEGRSLMMAARARNSFAPTKSATLATNLAHPFGNYKCCVCVCGV